MAIKTKCTIPDLTCPQKSVAGFAQMMGRNYLCGVNRLK